MNPEKPFPTLNNFVAANKNSYLVRATQTNLTRTFGKRNRNKFNQRRKNNLPTLKLKLLLKSKFELYIIID